MSDGHGPIVLEARFQHYAWGDREFIPTLFGIESSNQPYAEAWLGAHKSFPSLARAGYGTIPLDQFIESDPTRFLGVEIHSEFGELPYLVKVLSAARPLSIQVHPSKAQALAGYRRESAAAIPLDSPVRNYRDTRHKPEILVALTPFRALSGFRPLTEIVEAIDHAGTIGGLLPGYDARPDWLARLLAAYLSLPDTTIVPALSEWLERLSASSTSFGPDTPEYWVLECHRVFSRPDRPDRGLFLVLLLNLIVLEPWQALFLEAGVPHAYLSGSGLEVMANSDNVLRGGLTSKHIDTGEFLKILRFDNAVPFIIRSAETSREGAGFYRTTAEEFEVERLPLTDGISRGDHISRGPTMLMFLSRQPGARLLVRSENHTVTLGVAGTCMLPHGSAYEFQADGPGDLVRISVPVRSALDFRGHVPTRLSFGTSGLRGLVTDITDLETYVNVRGFLDYEVEVGDVEPGGEIALAGDLRPTTDSRERSIMAAVACACRDAGFTVSNEGKLPTPALSYYAFQKRLPSIMVTGSHIPFDRNGIKFNRSDGELLKADELPVLKAVEHSRRAEYMKPSSASRFDDRGMFRTGHSMELPPPTDNARKTYMNRYLDFLPAGALVGVRVVVYQHSAVGRDVLVEILMALGAEVHAMGRAETFIPIDTEAISDADLSKLSGYADAARKQYGPVDAVVSTDGDSDRPLVVAVGPTGQTRFIAGDLIGILVAEYLKADGIVVPVSATDAIELAFAHRPVKVVRTRIGSPWVIASMNQLTGSRSVGFEANGGFLVGSIIVRGGRTLRPLPTRDSVLPILALLHAAKEKSTTLWALAAELPKRYGKSGLLDAVPPKELAALGLRFNSGETDLLAMSFKDDRVTVTRTDGMEHEASGSTAAHAADLRNSLAHLFPATLGFGQVEHLDFRDGMRIRFEGGDIAHARGSGNAPQLRIYAFANSEQRAADIVSLSVREPDGILRSLLADAVQREFSAAILRNIAHTAMLFEQGSPPEVIGTVCGSESARRFWQHRLDEIHPAFKAREAISFYEDLPVNQAFGLLLLWHRLRDRLRPKEGALIAFVFGDGTRATPFTETDNGQKPAMSSFVKLPGAPMNRHLAMVELALKYFAPVEAYLRRSGFDGVVVKWGDEVQIATRDLSGQNDLLNGADIVRFVSKRTMTESDAANKDWLGVDSAGNVTAFIPRRPLSEMRLLADRGLIERRGDSLVAGVNLGSIAVSRVLLDELLAEFAGDVLDSSAERSRRPDLDPQFFTALMVATIDNPNERKHTWDQYLSELQDLRSLEQNMPDIQNRIRRVLDGFVAKYGRAPRIVALDFGDQYWGDVGQHRQIYEFYLTPNDRGPFGTIARALAGLPERRDSNGNILLNSRIGRTRVVNSVLIDCQIESGEILDSVLVGTCGRAIRATAAFDIGSTVGDMTLNRRAGGYKVVSGEPINANAGERITTLFLPDGRDVLMRVLEDTDLRDKRTTYEVPILGNPLSFKEAHSQMSRIDPAELEKRRRAAADSVTLGRQSH